MSIESAITDVETFHAASGIKDLQPTDKPKLRALKLRRRLIKEEYKELKRAWKRRDIVATADAYADLIYVTLGSALMHLGKSRFIDVWKEVQRSNMAKMVNGKVRMRSDGKVLKPEGWVPPQLEDIFQRPGRNGSERQACVTALRELQSSLGATKRALVMKQDERTLQAVDSALSESLTALKIITDQIEQGAL